MLRCILGPHFFYWRMDRGHLKVQYDALCFMPETKQRKARAAKAMKKGLGLKLHLPWNSWSPSALLLPIQLTKANNLKGLRRSLIGSGICQATSPASGRECALFEQPGAQNLCRTWKDRQADPGLEGLRGLIFVSLNDTCYSQAVLSLRPSPSALHPSLLPVAAFSGCSAPFFPPPSSSN